jgi:hypothetical protein
MLRLAGVQVNRISKGSHSTNGFLFIPRSFDQRFLASTKPEQQCMPFGGIEDLTGRYEKNTNKIRAVVALSILRTFEYLKYKCE